MTSKVLTTPLAGRLLLTHAADLAKLPGPQKHPPNSQEPGEGAPLFLALFWPCQSLESAKSWKPQLTVPKGPELRTVRRVSLGRRPSSCPPADEEEAPPPHAKTPRHRVEIRRPVDTERRPVTRTPGKMVVTPVARPTPRPTDSAVKAAKQGGHRTFRASTKDLEYSDRKENVKPVVKRSPSDEFLSRSTGAGSPVSGGGLNFSRSSKLLRGGFAGAQQPPGMRVSFGSTTPRPCCL
ncbi:unnamed protein product [Symbiodinium natans]|uniref:Uncharacterized protein n=1 Tax=Symbiodinium natans TaxID=878477 RepID=A0A812KBL0_9DINO|nr:unnamed protein product [Symbiodinium natans]